MARRQLTDDAIAREKKSGKHDRSERIDNALCFFVSSIIYAFGALSILLMCYGFWVVYLYLDDPNENHAKSFETVKTMATYLVTAGGAYGVSMLKRVTNIDQN